jgi:hypothetical protein
MAYDHTQDSLLIARWKLMLDLLLTPEREVFRESLPLPWPQVLFVTLIPLPCKRMSLYITC